MSITCTWDSQSTNILHLKFPPAWDWQELFYATRPIREKLRERDGQSVVIADMRESQKVPVANFFRNAEQLMASPHPHVEKVIIVGANRVLVNAYNAFCRIYVNIAGNLPIHFAETMEEALHMTGHSARA